MQMLQHAQGNAASKQLMQLHKLQVAAKVVQVAGSARVGYHVMSRLPCQAGGSAAAAAMSEADTEVISKSDQQWLPIILTLKHLHAHAYAHAFCALVCK